jgi:hypothetical protein
MTSRHRALIIDIIMYAVCLLFWLAFMTCAFSLSKAPGAGTEIQDPISVTNATQAYTRSLNSRN